MDHDKRAQSGSREIEKKGPPLGLVIALAAAGGMIIGSAGTYFLSRPATAPTQSEAPAVSVAPTAGGPLPAQTSPAPQITFAPPPNQYTPAPQPPGEAPPGKVWSVEHGHWHDAPAGAPPMPVP